MSTAEEVFSRHFPGLTPAEVDEELSVAPGPGATPISAGAVRYVRAHGGEEAEAALASGDGRASGHDRAVAAARGLEELLATSLTLDDAATELGVSRSRISHRISDRSLYAITIGGRRHLPRWQFRAGADGAEVLPGLHRIVPAIPKTLHPLAVEAFMTSPLAEVGVTPADYVWSAGDVELVVDWLVALGHG